MAKRSGRGRRPARPHPGSRRAASSAPAAAGRRLRFPERALVALVHAGLGLVLATPLIWLPDVLYGFAVGKALWTRGLIAATFALWSVLAAARPQYRPRFSWLVAILAAGLAWALLAAPFGVSLQRSLWSDYVRMGGLVDAAHWVAFALMLVAMLRTGAAWRRFLNLHLAVGLAVALLAAARVHAGGAGAGWWPEAHWPRIAATLGNPIYLGAYMQGIALLAAGLLARSFAGADGGWAARTFWAAAAGAALWALGLAGSIGAAAGLGAGAGAAALAYARLGRSPAARRAGRVAAAGLALLGLVLAGTLLVRAAGPSGGAAPVFDSLLVERATSVERIASTLGTRLDNWSAGVRAFADRPLFGWGAENYLAAASRYDRAAAATNRARDRAHNMALEEAVTKGVPGLAAWLALWAATLAAAWRAARRLPPPDQALAVFAGAALLGWLVQSLSAFYAAALWLQHLLLLAYLAHAGIALRPPGPGLPGGLAALRAALARPVARAAGAAICVALGGASLATLPGVHGGAQALWRAEATGPFMAELRRSIVAFEPLATHPRILLAENVAPNFAVIHRHDPARALRLLAWAEAEAARALAAEPENWQLHHALAKMYTAVAAVHPAYRPQADRARARAREVAPFQDPLMPARWPGERRGARPADAGFPP